MVSKTPQNDSERTLEQSVFREQTAKPLADLLAISNALLIFESAMASESLYPPRQVRSSSPL